MCIENKKKSDEKTQKNIVKINAKYAQASKKNYICYCSCCVTGKKNNKNNEMQMQWEKTNFSLVYRFSPYNAKI